MYSLLFQLELCVYIHVKVIDLDLWWSLLPMLTLGTTPFFVFIFVHCLYVFCRDCWLFFLCYCLVWILLNCLALFPEGHHNDGPDSGEAL